MRQHGSFAHGCNASPSSALSKGRTDSGCDGPDQMHRVRDCDLSAPGPDPERKRLLSDSNRELLDHQRAMSRVPGLRAKVTRLQGSG